VPEADVGGTCEEIALSRIAGPAGISVGALYQFCSDQHRIFDAIAVRELKMFEPGSKARSAPAN
jgi:hypothetical protein